MIMMTLLKKNMKMVMKVMKMMKTMKKNKMMIILIKITSYTMFLNKALRLPSTNYWPLTKTVNTLYLTLLKLELDTLLKLEID